jgi:hypothetical protein
MLAFQAKQARTAGIDMYENGSCHYVIYARRMIQGWTGITAPSCNALLSITYKDGPVLLPLVVTLYCLSCHIQG